MPPRAAPIRPKNPIAQQSLTSQVSLALVALAYIITQQTQTALVVAGGTILIGLIYWAIVILPQRGRAWNLKEPLRDELDGLSEA